MTLINADIEFTVGAYLRFSSEMQRKASLEQQEWQCRKAAKDRNWTFADTCIWKDEAKSGTSRANRDCLNQMMEQLRETPGLVKVVMFDDTSRAGRDAVGVLELVEELRSNGIEVYFVAQNLDSRDADFQFKLTIYCAIDEQYSARLGRNVWRGQELQILKGLSAGGRCFGYENVKEASTDGYGKGRSLSRGTRMQVLESEAQTIRRIFQMFIDGMSAHRIAKVLNAEKVPAATRACPSRVSVTGALR